MMDRSRVIRKDIEGYEKYHDYHKYSGNFSGELTKLVHIVFMFFRNINIRGLLKTSIQRFCHYHMNNIEDSILYSDHVSEEIDAPGIPLTSI